jgi:hypothetical protein
MLGLAPMTTESAAQIAEPTRPDEERQAPAHDAVGSCGTVPRRAVLGRLRPRADRCRPDRIRDRGLGLYLPVTLAIVVLLVCS